MQFLRNKVVAVATAIICTTAVVAAGGATTVGIASANVNRSSVTHMALAQYPYRLAYTVIDPGTFGGPNSYFDGPGVPLTSNGTLVGQADTTTPCPPIGPCEDPYIQHAFTFQNARLTDLGALPGNNSSAIWELNSYGVGVGNSEDGLIDPNTGTEASVAVLFVHGQVIRLGALPGGYESQAQDISDQGQVAGFSSNGIPDPYSSVFLGWKTETRTFVWKNGVMTDIGTLGGPDAIEQLQNERGQIAGASFTNDTPNPYTGFPTLDPFLWQNGHMIDLGTLGGDAGEATWMNDSGEVVGFSEIAKDQAHHPFLWNGYRMIDLGTFGGSNGAANWINDNGDVAGCAQLPNGFADGALWTDGRMIELPPVDGAPNACANSLNDQDEVVGNTADASGNELDAVLWTRGSAYDLNALVAPSALHLTSAEYINNGGDVVSDAMLSNGDQRLAFLVPNYGVPLPAASTTAVPQLTMSSANGGATAFRLAPADRGDLVFTGLRHLMAEPRSTKLYLSTRQAEAALAITRGER